MRISVIIPALNEAASIARAVEHAWLIDACEVIVADGGSRDGTRERARALKAHVIASPQGRAVQQNAGAQQATGEILLFQHADTWLEPDAGQQMRALLQDPAIIGGAFRQRIDAPEYAFRLIEWGNAQRARWLKMAYGDQGIFLRRALFEAIGGFPEAPLMEDVLLMKKLRGHGRMLLLPGPLHVSARRWQRHGILRQTLRNWSLLTAHRAGVSEERLAGFYRRHDA